jgi:site-specific DNA-methyltransferase (adenine-specific)
MKEQPYRLIQGDCLQVLKELPNKSIDCIITDPPYGINETAEKNNSRGGACKPTKYASYLWDKQRITKQYFDEMFRISKNQMVCGGNYYTDFLYPSPCWIVWDKRVKDSIKNDFADCELIWTSFNKCARMFRFLWCGMLQGKRHKELRTHPTQKPLDLMEWLIKNFSDEGDTILDPFMGSGTTGVAALRLNRNFIGIELDENYFKIAEKRITQESQQERLFK